MSESNVEDFWKYLFTGIRVRSLRKFLYFVLLVKQRFKNLDWDEWTGRDTENRSHLLRRLDNYLAYRDKEEIELFMCYLGSERLVHDYWKTMLRLLFLLVLD